MGQGRRCCCLLTCRFLATSGERRRSFDKQLLLPELSLLSCSFLSRKGRQREATGCGCGRITQGPVYSELRQPPGDTGHPGSHSCGAEREAL